MSTTSNGQIIGDISGDISWTVKADGAVDVTVSNGVTHTTATFTPGGFESVARIFDALVIDAYALGEEVAA